MNKSKRFLAVLLSLGMAVAGSSCAADEENQKPLADGSSAVAEVTEAASESSDSDSVSSDDGQPVQNDAPAEVQAQVSETPVTEYVDNIWAAFLVSPNEPAYTNAKDGYRILDVLCQDSVIGDIASMSRNAEAPEDTVAYDEKVITAGGPVSTANLAFGKLSEIPDSFLNAMVSDMKAEIGEEYGNHSGGAGMGYRTFYQASYEADGGYLQVNQQDGYWARTLGAYSEHCAGVAVDFDISYNNSEQLESTGRYNRGESTPANAEFTWLADNAHKYGFIWRYKISGSADSVYGMKTGTIREGWHWRFVGVYNATKFWEKCASDTNGDGVPDAGYMTNDNYIWEDYYIENIYPDQRYPRNMLEAFTEFYNTSSGTKCTWDEYNSR